ncbi:hypothetical protein [Saccharothrix obliqua]|uniref:hypothetical protein n=1 Tax=Saccharothrix obliqua TaxID=2861747 RepID=UPI001C5E57D1|nr:hypothetical protein [Saccharothrix obliqua]MBW4722057.1 hypothetical protein [Saccharothrix obliqua]
MARLIAAPFPATSGIGRLPTQFMLTLADPDLHHLGIAAIAARRGFPRPADFSRVFRRETGVPPRDFRFASHVRPDVG